MPTHRPDATLWPGVARLEGDGHAVTKRRDRGRTQQAGTLVAATIMPITFQPTLMPRSGLDQALVTGISTSLNYAFAALIQDSIEAVGLRGAGRSDPVGSTRARPRRRPSPSP